MLMSHIALTVFVALLMCGCSDTVTSRYETRAEAEAERLFDRGWLPSIIPRSSNKITTRNDLDLNISEGEFYFDPSDTTEFIRHLSAIDGSSSYTYEEGNSTWIFDIDSKAGHSRYSMRLRR
jgi:uncharacterized membrane-anchored protein